MTNTVEHLMLDGIFSPRPSLMVCSQKIIEIAKRDTSIDVIRINKIHTLYGLTDAQSMLYINTLIESKEVFEDVSKVTGEIAEYVHSVLEGYL